MKVCRECNETKSLEEFSKNKQCKDGITNLCKKCKSLIGIEFKKTKVGIIDVIYQSQKASSKKRGHIKPYYTITWLREWMFSQELFHELYNNWYISGYDKYIKPSVDRKNDYLPYTKDNIQLITFGENVKKKRPNYGFIKKGANKCLT